MKPLILVLLLCSCASSKHYDYHQAGMKGVNYPKAVSPSGAAKVTVFVFVLGSIVILHSDKE